MPPSTVYPLGGYITWTVHYMKLNSPETHVEHKKPIIVEFVVRRYAKKTNVETVQQPWFFVSCSSWKGTESLYQTGNESTVGTIAIKECTDSFTADAVGISFPRTCCGKHKNLDNREPCLFKEKFRCSEKPCLCSKTYCCYNTSNILKLSSKCLYTQILEQVDDGTFEK